MSDQDIRSAFMSHLNALSFMPAPTIAWDPDKFEPTHSAPYLKPYYRQDAFVPLSTSPVQHRAQFTLEVQCWVGERDGEDEAYRLADAVSDHFFPATGDVNSITSTAGVQIHINRKPDKDPLVARPAGFKGVAVLIRGLALI
ncbi:MAG: phage tail terminator-like protein [Pseudomonadota bacterium]